jgi:alanine racemase
LTAADQLAESTRKRIIIHLKIDTGMERIGVREYEAEALIERSLACSQFVEVEGIFTHFANSETLEPIGLPIADNKLSESRIVKASLQLERSGSLSI